VGWEVPGGLVDEGEEPAEAAARELEEQKGYRARRLEHLITFQPVPEVADGERIVFVGRGAELASGIQRSCADREKIVHLGL
jgi:8-oxo-dGTP pyrophosphatase MutT (NUDIX family)